MPTINKPDLNSAVPVDAQGQLLPDVDLSSARPVGLLETPPEVIGEGVNVAKDEAAQKEKTEVPLPPFRNFVDNIGRYAPALIQAQTEATNIKAITPAIELAADASQRSKQAVGTTVREMIQQSKSFYGFKSDPANEGLMKAFIAGFAPELNPDYPPDKITTIGRMFKGYSEALSKKYDDAGMYPYISEETKATNIARGLTILSETAGRTILEIAGMYGDFASDPFAYLIMRGITKGALMTVEDIPMFKKDLLRDFSFGMRGPETISLKSEGGDAFRGTFNKVLNDGQIQDLTKTLGGPEVLDEFFSGRQIQLPNSVGVALTDKPYWATIKRFFGQQPTTSGIRIFSKTPSPAFLSNRGSLMIPPEYNDLLRYGEKGVGKFLRMEGTQEAVLMMGGQEIKAKLSELEFVRKQLPERAPLFYSKMASVLAEKMPESAPADQVRGIISSAQIPQEEIDWSGVEEFLKGKEKVSKPELLNYLNENKMDIEETIRGGVKSIDIDKFLNDPVVKRFENLGWKVQINEDAIMAEEGAPPIAFEDPETGEFLDSSDISELAKKETDMFEKNKLEKIAKLAREVENFYNGASGDISKGPKYAQYTVPGGENYREMLLQVPSKKEMVTVNKVTGGATRHNFAGLPSEYIQAPFGKKGNWVGMGHKIPWADFSNRVTQKTFNVLKYLEETRNVVWTEAKVFPYDVGTRHTQRFVVNGIGNPDPGTHFATVAYQFVRDPGKLTGAGSTKIYVDNKPFSISDLLPDHQTVIPEYNQEGRVGSVTTTSQRERIVGPAFQGGHWEEKNVFAHIRLKDRTDAEGNKVLFVEEFQSDWNLKGRKEGFKKAGAPKEYHFDDLKAIHISGTTWRVFAPGIEQPIWTSTTSSNEREAKYEAIGATQNKGSVPYHPAVERWLEIALKRVLRYAAENGYDKVAWASGKQTADHYNLAKYVDSIEWTALNYKVDDLTAEEPEDGYKNDWEVYDRTGKLVGHENAPTKGEAIARFIKRHPGDEVIVDARKDGASLVMKTVKVDELEGLIGKGPADKIQEGIKNNIRKDSVTGQDLQVGGHWATNLYDQRVPKWLNEYSKKFGVQVEPVDIGSSTPQYDLQDNIDMRKMGTYDIGIGAERLADTALHPIQESDMPSLKNSWALFQDGEFLEAIPNSSIMPEAEARKQLIDMLKGWEDEDDKLRYLKLIRNDDGTMTQMGIALTPQFKNAILYQGQPILGKIATDIGKAGVQPYKMQIFRMDEKMKIINTQGESVTLPKGEEYRTLPVYDAEGNVVPNKLRLQDGKQLTVFVGELSKLKGKILPEGEMPKAGGLTHPRKYTMYQGKGRKDVAEIYNKPEIGAALGGAEYYAFNERDAAIYGPEITTHEVETKNPYEITTDQEWSNLINAAGVKYAKFWTQPTEQALADKEKIITYLKKQGHDSVIVFPDPTQETSTIMGLFAHKQVIKLDSGAKPPKKPPQTATGAGPAGELPQKGSNPRQKERKANLELWNTPSITNKLLSGEREFLKKYLEEGKTLAQIAKELGEDIEDTKKTEMWVHAHMNEIADQERAAMEEAGNADEREQRNLIKDTLKGKLDPKLLTEGEYAELKHLPWLFAEGGQRPDVLASELGGIIGAPLETEADVISLIKTYFQKEIETRAMLSETRESKAAREKLQKGLSVKVKPQKPERQITGVGNGSVISDKENVDFEERSKIFRGMPFALLGNKAEVIARMTRALRAALRLGVEKVYDLWGGAKGYRSGLFSDLPATNYNLNELSDERNNYYQNVQDPAKQAIMKQTLDKIMTDFVGIMNDAFDLPQAKDDKDFLDMLNSWLKMGLQRERYYFAKEVIQDYGNKLLEEARADKFASPESSAKYFFLENTSIFGIGPDGWTQGIIRTTKGDSSIRDVLNKLTGLSGKLDMELKRDAGMPIGKDDAWVAMDKLTANIKAGTVDPKTTAVMVDPQYLNPTEEGGTYSVGASDTTWEGHKQNLEKHLLPLIKTGAKIIYTNNADQNLINWLRAKKLPYNIEKSIGAVADRRGRDEVISLIGFNLGPEWTVGQIHTGGAESTKPGEQYVAPRLTGESAKFSEWLKKQEEKRQIEAQKQNLITKMDDLRKSKMLSKVTVSRVKKYLGIAELKNTAVPELQKVVDYLEGLKTGDKLLTEKQIETLSALTEDVESLKLMPKRIAIEQFGENEELLDGLITGKLALEVMPTVDIKEGHPLLTKLLDRSDATVETGEENIRVRDNDFEKLISAAEKSRAVSLKFGEKLKRALLKQNKEIFQALSGEKSQIDLTPAEQVAFIWLKDFFLRVRKALELKKYRMNYVTHLEQPLSEKILEHGIIGAVIQYFKEQGAKKEMPTDIMLELDNIIGSEKFFRFALQRTGGIEPTTNLRKIVHDYSSLFESKIALDQILPEGQMVTKLLLKGKSAVWLKKFLQNLKGRGLDNEFRTGRMGWLTKVGDGIVDASYIMDLALNYGSAIKNIVAGESNAIIWQDFSSYVKGKQRFIGDPRFATRLAISHGILEGTYADYTQRGIGKFKKLQDMAMIGQRLGEIEIRTCMFAGELTDKEWETGEISAERSRKLKDNIAITQGIFSKTDSPLWVQSVLGRVIMQMNRWRITNFMLSRRIINDAKDNFKKGNFKGKHSERLAKMLLFWGIGMYSAYQLGKEGHKKGAQIAQSMAQVIDGTLALFSQGDLARMITDNPTLAFMKKALFSIQAGLAYIGVPGARRPSRIEIKEGIEDTYLAPLNTVNEILNSINE